MNIFTIPNVPPSEILNKLYYENENLYFDPSKPELQKRNWALLTALVVAIIGAAIVIPLHMNALGSDYLIATVATTATIMILILIKAGLLQKGAYFYEKEKINYQNLGPVIVDANNRGENRADIIQTLDQKCFECLLMYVDTMDLKENPTLISELKNHPNCHTTATNLYDSNLIGPPLCDALKES